MKRRENKSIITGLLLFVFMLLLSNCSGGGGGGGGTTPGTCMNVAGTWTTTEQVNSTTCVSGIYTENGRYTVAQNGCSLAVQDASGNTFSGAINGSQITWSGSYPDAGGTTSITAMALNVAADGTSFNGSCAWTWSGAGSTCSGSTGVTGTLATGGGGGDTVAPAVPAGLTATAGYASQIDLSWTASTDNVGVTGYMVYRGGAFLKNVTGTTTSDTGLSPGTQYCYTVSAVDAAGNESQQSAQQCASTQAGGGGGDTAGPTVPSGLVAVPVSSNQINLTWTASNDNMGVAGYKVYSDTGALLATVTAGTSTPMTGLFASTQYCYKVSAYDAANNESAQSTQICATTKDVPTYTLSVLKGGTGNGTITGTGISCGTDCSQTFTDGTAVTLTAAASSGATFSSWLGCDTVSGPACTIAMTRDKTVTASFTQTGLSLGVTITNLPATSTTGNYTLQWACTGMLCTNVFTVQEDSDTSFASPSNSWTFTGGQTSLTFTGKANGTYCYRVAFGGGSSWCDPKCIAVARPTAATLHIVNNTHYDLIDIRLNTVQQIFYPYVIYPGQAADFTFTGSGQVAYALGSGFYDWDGSKFVWFTYSGTANVTVGQTTTVTFPNPTLGQMLTGFNPSGMNWDGTYYCYSCATMVHTARYHFDANGNWIFYDDGVQRGSGTASLVSWPDYSSYVRFKLCATCANIDLWAPFGTFSYQNGPPDWPIIEYVGQ